MHQHVLLYIKQGLEAYQKAFSPVIIIEDQYLQTFVHTLETYSDTFVIFLKISNSLFTIRIIRVARERFKLDLLTNSFFECLFLHVF